MGRPTLLTEDRADRIVKMIRNGAYQHIAAAANGVHEATFYRWMAEGAKEDAAPLYREFREAVEEAKAAAEVGALLQIRAAAADDWKAAAWFLERTRPDRYSRRVEHAGPGGGPVHVRTETIETLLLDAGVAQDVADASIDAELRALTAGGPEPG